MLPGDDWRDLIVVRKSVTTELSSIVDISGQDPM
jgi:hypothetical protein